MKTDDNFMKQAKNRMKTLKLWWYLFFYLILNKKFFELNTE